MPTQRKTTGPAKKAASTAKRKTVKKEQKPKEKQTKKIESKGEDTELLRKVESNLKEVSEDASKFASEIAEKTSKIAEDLYGKLKKGVSGAYDVSAVMLDDIVQSAEKYADKYKHKVEMRRLNSEREELTQELGSIVYSRFHQKKAFDTAFFSEKRLNTVLAKIEKLDKEIIKIGRKLDKK